MKAVAVFQGNLKGSYCSFYQDDQNGPVKVNGHIKGLPSGKHGLHIHKYGDIRATDCSKCGGHWNPKNRQHGGLNDIESHAGDLGNITANERGQSKFHIRTNKFTLFGSNSVLGRSIVIHVDEDDLGKGGHSDSLTTGHAGARLDCAVIGIAKFIQ